MRKGKVQMSNALVERKRSYCNSLDYNFQMSENKSENKSLFQEGPVNILQQLCNTKKKEK